MLLGVVILYFLWILNSISAYLESGDLCQLKNNEVGVCKHVHSCPSAIEDLKMKKRPKTCSFDSNTPVVCCLKGDNSLPSRVKPPYEEVVEKDFGKVSSEKCKNYADLVYQNHSSPTLLPDVLFEIEDTCAVKEENYDESNVLAREFPHLASLGYDSPSGQVWKCSGALISDRHILTAASCYNLPKHGLAKYVRVGSTSVRENFYHENPLQYINIQEFIKHPRFDLSTLANNLGVVKLEEPVKFTSIVRPACLHVSKKRPEEAITVGWGTFNNDGYLNNEPLKSLMRIADPSNCIGLKSNQLCIEQVPGSRWQNCLIDQGSVLQIYNKENYCTYDIIGVIIDWKDCRRNTAGVYTNITSYVRWIERTVWG